VPKTKSQLITKLEKKILWRVTLETCEELKTALLSVKPGKATGLDLDGVYPEFIKNSGRKTKEWLVRLDTRQTSKTVQTSQNCRHFEAWERRY
jgi:hypothetical protein